jgi:SAM-dependent methyltransferase
MGGATAQVGATADFELQEWWLSNLSRADAFTRWTLEEIAPWLGQHVLEVGCGIGTYTAEIADGIRTVIAVDMDPAFIQTATERLGQRRNVRLVCGDITRSVVSLADEETFDTVILLDVLEHIEDDIGVLTSLRSKLRPGGHVVVKVPAMNFLYSQMDLSLGHWRRYDKIELSAVIHSSGFDLVEVWRFNAFAILGWWWNGRVLKRTLPPPCQVALFNSLVPVIRPLDRFARLMCGMSLIAIARRPAPIEQRKRVEPKRSLDTKRENGPI